MALLSRYFARQRTNGEVHSWQGETERNEPHTFQQEMSRTPSNFPSQPLPSPQRSFFCRACWLAPPIAGGLCRSCYDAAYRSASYFSGHREQVLERDGNRCRVCQGGEGLAPHHRRPGDDDPAWLITLCVRCHAKIHRSRQLRRYEPELLLELWAEQHAGRPLQGQLPLAEEAAA